MIIVQFFNNSLYPVAAHIKIHFSEQNIYTIGLENMTIQLERMREGKWENK